MKRLMVLAALAWLGISAPAWTGGLLCGSCGRCITPPQSCPDCGCPCDRGLHFCTARKSERAHCLIDELNEGNCCERIRTVKKLGCRLHADFCCDPEVLGALVHVLLCDPCWEVRQAAAWSIATQRAGTDFGVLALYVATKLDTHSLVRDKAAEALDIVMLCRKDCFKDLYATGDSLVKAYRGKYKPGTESCDALFDAIVGAH